MALIRKSITLFATGVFSLLMLIDTAGISAAAEPPQAEQQEVVLKVENMT